MSVSVVKNPGIGTAALVTGFGATVCMWAAAYVCRMPPVAAPGPVLLLLFVACMFGGGFVAGRFSHGGWKAGALTGLLVSALNMAVLGSLLSGGRPNAVNPSAAWWLPGFVFFSAALGATGAAAGGASSRSAAKQPNWTQSFACVSAAATFLLLAVGGLVTGNKAGLAVVDWPNTYGYNIFLYPLSRMTGGIYYEHAHRLFGSLVGLTMLSFTIYLLRNESRRPVRLFALLSLTLVIVQGLIGGLRVTGGFTLSERAIDMAPNTTLAIVHGVTGQLFFCAAAALCTIVSTTWRGDTALTSTRAAMERATSTALCVLLLFQIVLGALVRHLGAALLIHIAVAMVAALFALFCGVRAWGIYRDIPALRRTGVTLICLACAQLFLGMLSVVTTGVAGVGKPITEFRVLITTAHQLDGALLLAFSVMLTLWYRRILRDA